MTLDEAVELANRVASESAHRISVDDAKRLARFLRDTLATQMPCGIDEPRVEVSPRDGCLFVSWYGMHFDKADEMRGVAAAWLRAADELDALQAKGGE
jgi:hypothetical protein